MAARTRCVLLKVVVTTEGRLPGVGSADLAAIPQLSTGPYCPVACNRRPVADGVRGLDSGPTMPTSRGSGRLEVGHQLECDLRTEPAPPSLEIEGLLRVLLGDQGTAGELRAALEATARQARELTVNGVALVEELRDTGGEFPKRLHVTERVASFYAEFLQLLIRWCEETLAEVETWPDTRDLGITPRGRERLEAIARVDPSRLETFSLNRR